VEFSDDIEFSDTFFSVLKQTLIDQEEYELIGLLDKIKDSVKKAMPSSYESALAEKGQTPASVRKMMIDGPKKGDYVMPPIDVPKRGGHKYEHFVQRA
jgi:hypothetical protein